MIDATHPLPIARQAQLLELSRSSVYYQPQPTSDADLALMRRIDELHLEHPFAGSRMLRDLLRREGFEVGRKHVTTLMRRMGIEALYQRPRTSGRDREHPVFPYLLRGMTHRAAESGLGDGHDVHSDARGFVYLAAVVDWASRRVLAFRVSISMAADAAVRRSEEAIARYGCREIMNTDQGSQFTATDFIDVLASTTSASAWTARAAGATTCSSSGCGKRSSTSTSICTPTRAFPRRARRSRLTSSSTIARRPHSRIDRRTPDEAYFDLPSLKAAA